MSREDARIDVADCSGAKAGGRAYFARGGAFFTNRSETTIINCTLARNSAPEGGGIFNASDSTLTVYNSIIWGSGGGGIRGDGTRSIHFTDNPRVVELNDAEFRSWIRLLCYCGGAKDPTVCGAPASGERRLSQS